MNLTLYTDVLDTRMIDDTWDEMSPEEQINAVQLLVQNETASIEKVSRMMGYVRNREALVDVCKAEEKRIATRRKSIENFNEKLMDAIKSWMIGTGRDSVEAGTFRLSLRKNPPSVEITDEAAIPSQYIRVKTEPIKSDIAKALKAGEEVPGARLETERISLVVK